MSILEVADNELRYMSNYYRVGDEGWTRVPQSWAGNHFRIARAVALQHRTITGLCPTHVDVFGVGSDYWTRLVITAELLTRKSEVCPTILRRFEKSEEKPGPPPPSRPW